MIDPVAYLNQAWPELKRVIKSERMHIDPAKHPVYCTLIDAYCERFEAAYRAGEKGVDERVIQEINELSPWVVNQFGISAEDAHATVLSEMMHEAGQRRELSAIIEVTRKAPRGRPLEATLAIEALELHLVHPPRSLSQIAALLFPGHINGREHVKKLVRKARRVYEKYRCTK